MAIGLALIGGVGIIHRSQSIEAQASMVRKVKQYQTGFILQVSTLSPRHSVADALRVQAEQSISGIPITQDGKMGGRLVGIVTKRDLEGIEDTSSRLRDHMTTNVVSISEPVVLREAREKMQRNKVGKLPVVNDDKELVALICRGDLKREWENPQASRDANKQLLCAAALSAVEEDAWDRANALIDAGVDVLYLDTGDGVTVDTLGLIKDLMREFEGTDIIAGPVKSRKQAKDLCEVGVDGILVGGCTGTEATDAYEIAKFARNSFGVPVLVDGAVHNVGQMLKAFCVGASSVALGASMLAGTEEAPGDYFYKDGIRVKVQHVPQGQGFGLAGGVVNKGSVKVLVPHLVTTVQLGMQELGLKSLSEIHAGLNAGTLRLEQQLPCEALEQPLQLQRVAVPALYNCW